MFVANNTNELTPEDEGIEYEALLDNHALWHEWCLADPQTAHQSHLRAGGIKDLECQVLAPTKTVEERTIYWFDFFS